MFDATDLETARREHSYEMGAESLTDRAWSRFYNQATAAIRARGWDEKFDNGKSRGLDGCDWETGYSIDGAYEAFEKRWSLERYIASVDVARKGLGL